MPRIARTLGLAFGLFGGLVASQAPEFAQVVGMFDAANGTVRDAVLDYAIGRHEPAGPMAEREYFASMDRYAGFAWHSLTEQLLVRIRNGR